MCGIVGVVNTNNKQSIRRKEFIRMLKSLYHRGPDDSGYSFNSLSNCNIALGHRRLSILDLSNHGHQPMSFEN